MRHLPCAGHEFLEVALEIRRVINSSYETIRMSHELVQRSRLQSASDPIHQNLDTSGHAPSVAVVDCLIGAYEAAINDGDAMTVSMIAAVVQHVGDRIAMSIGAEGAGLTIQ